MTRNTAVRSAALQQATPLRNRGIAKNFIQAFFPLRLFLAFVLPAFFSTVALAGSAMWNVDAAGSWPLTNNWSPNTTFPNAIDDIASLTNNIGAARTISLQQPDITIGTLRIGDMTATFYAFTIASGTNGTLTFDVSSGNATITKNTNTATDVISAPITLNDNLDVNMQASSGGITISGNIDDNNAGRAITKLGSNGVSGVLILSGYNTFGGGVTLREGSLRLGSSRVLGTGTLTISNGVLNTSVPNLVLTNNNPVACNGDFVFTGTYNLDIGAGPVTLNANRKITVNALTLAIGGAINDGGNGYGLTKLGAGTLQLGNANTYRGTTRISNGTLRVSSVNRVSGGSASSSLGAPTTVANGTIHLGSNPTAGTLRYVGTGETSDRVINLAGTTGGGVLQNDGSGTLIFTNSNFTASGAGAKTLTLQGSNIAESIIYGNITNSSSATSLTKSGIGTWVLANGSNTFTGATAINGGGTLVLDYDATNNSKLANASALTLGGAASGGALVLRGGSHTEIVSASTLSTGTFRIVRSSGASVLRMNTLTRVAGGIIDFSSNNIAQIDNANAKGILGGYATVGGTDWAMNVTGGGDGFITNYTGYTVGLPASGGSTNINYSHTGPQTLTGNVLVNTLKLANSADSETLIMGANNLTCTWSSATLLGGLLYVGGYDNNYTISGTGRIGATNEFIVNVYTGQLTIAAPIIGAFAGSLTKTGNGTLVLSTNSLYTGTTRINQGVLNIRANTAAGTTAGGIVVAPGAALELQGGITVGTEALTLTGAGIAGGGALRNISGTNRYLGAITLGADGARINSDSGELILTNTLVTAALRDLTVGGAGTVTKTNSAISGAGNIIKTGSGVLNLNSANTFTGIIRHNGGTIRAGNATGLGPAANATVIFGDSSSGILRLGTNATIIGLSGDSSATVEKGTAGPVTLTINNGGDWTYAGIIQNGAAGFLSLTKSGPGKLTLSNPANTYTNITTISGGMLSVPTLANGGVASSIGSSAATAGYLVLGGGILQYTGNTVAINRNYTLTAATISTIEITDDDATLTISGASTATTGNLTKSGPGTLKLSGANLYTGTTRVKAGTLAYGISNALASGPVTVDGTNAVLAMGSCTDSVGMVTLKAGAITGTNGTLASTVNPFMMKGNSDTFVSANLAGNVGLDKSGSGTLRMTGTNNYKGLTIISNGTLRVDGFNNCTNLVIATNNGTLGGFGVVGGSVRIYTGGVLAPGSNSIGILTVTNGVTFTGGTFRVNVTSTNSGDYGQVKVTGGNVIITNATLAVNGTNYTPGNNDCLWIINNTNAGTVSGAFDNLPEGGQTNIADQPFKIYYNANLATSATNGGNDVLLVCVPTKSDQTITNFPNPGEQTATNTVGLWAQASSGLAVTNFAVISGPGVISALTNLTFTNSGEVSITADQPGNANWNPAPTVTNTFNVTKATATVTLNNLTQTYDGSARTVTATTAPGGLTVDITYDGNSWAPTNVGSYAVTGVVNDIMYQGSTNRTLTVSKGSQTITNFPNPGDQITTNTVGLWAQASSRLDVTNFAVISGPGVIAALTNLTFTNSGAVSVTADQPGDDNWNAVPTVTNTFNVTKATAAVTLYDTNQIYNGQARVVTNTTDPAGLQVDITYDGNTWAPTNVGTYAVTGVVDEAMYQGSTNGTLTVYEGANPTTNSIPWHDDFESYTNQTPLINGTNGWYASAGSCVVQTNVKHTGSQAAMIPIDVTLSNRFVGTNERIVRIGMFVQPQLSNGADTPAIFTNVAAQFFINSNGYFVVGNGTNWNEITNKTDGASARPITNTYFTRIQINLRYKNHTWDLKAWTNDADLAASTYYVNFTSNLNTFSGFNIDNSNSTSYADNVSLCGRYINYVDDVSVTNIDFNFLPAINDVPFDDIESIGDAQPAEINDIINE